MVAFVQIVLTLYVKGNYIRFLAIRSVTNKIKGRRFAEEQVKTRLVSRAYYNTLQQDENLYPKVNKNFESAEPLSTISKFIPQ